MGSLRSPRHTMTPQSGRTHVGSAMTSTWIFRVPYWYVSILTSMPGIAEVPTPMRRTMVRAACARRHCSPLPNYMEMEIDGESCKSPLQKIQHVSHELAGRLRGTIPAGSRPHSPKYVAALADRSIAGVRSREEADRNEPLRS